MKGIIASSPLFVQPATNPFAIIVYEFEPGVWCCHIHYPGNNAFEHGVYGDLAEAMQSFSDRVAYYTKQTLVCSGRLDYYPPLPHARLRRKLVVMDRYTDRAVYPIGYRQAGEGESYSIIGEINSCGGTDDECRDLADRIVACWNAHIEPA